MSARTDRPEEDGFQRFMRTAGNHRLLSAAEERELARRVREHGDEAAREKLITHNVRLVISIARQHFAYRDVELEDLVQQGLLGLHHATTRFDERKGFRFSTYATQWVYQHMQRLAARGDLIRLPGEITNIRLTHANEPELSVRELAARHKTTVRKAHAALNAGQVTASLDAPASREGPGPVHEVVADDALGVEELIEDGWFGSTLGLAEAVAELPADQRAVIEASFARDLTDTEVADDLGLTRREVVRLRKEALASLRDVLT